MDGSSIKSECGPLPLRPRPHPCGARRSRGLRAPAPRSLPLAGAHRPRGQLRPRSPRRPVRPEPALDPGAAPFGWGPEPGPYAAAGDEPPGPQRPPAAAPHLHPAPTARSFNRFPACGPWSPYLPEPAKPPAKYRLQDLGPGPALNGGHFCRPEEGNARRRGALLFTPRARRGLPALPVAYFRKFLPLSPLGTALSEAGPEVVHWAKGSAVRGGRATRASGGGKGEAGGSREAGVATAPGPVGPEDGRNR